MSLLRQRQIFKRLQQLFSSQVKTQRYYSANDSSEEHYDIIIGGGGLVGTALAASLANNNSLTAKRVLLLEGAPTFKGFNENAPYGNRVSAINDNTVNLFKQIGAWERISSARIKPVKQMQVWDACSEARINFQDDNFARDVAFIVENDLMLDALYKLLADKEKAPNVQVCNLARIDSVCLSNEHNALNSVCLKDGNKYTCELIIGADGANSLVRKEMNVDIYSLDYQSKGVVATIQLAETDDNCVAWQRFLPTGPVALLPLTDNMSSLVWSTTNAQAEHLVKLPAEEFVEQLNEAFCKEFSQNSVVTNAVSMLNSVMGQSPTRQYPPRAVGVLENSRASFPLGFLHASSYVRTGAALIGDAAHRVHPLAGQGVNLGFSDVVHLVEALAEGAYAGAQLNDLNYLLKYEQRSLLKNVPIMIGVHGLHSLYTTDFSPVVLLRSLGLQFTHNVPTIKNMFMKRALG